MNDTPKTLFATVLRSELECMRARIDEQARELAALRAQQPVAWQFCDEAGKWWNGDDRIKDHRANTQEAGYLIRDLFPGPVISAQHPGVVLPERKSADPVFPYDRGFNACLDEVARLNSSHVSAETAHFINCTVENYCKEGVLFSSQACGVDERAADMALAVIRLADRYLAQLHKGDSEYKEGIAAVRDFRAALTASAQSVPDGWVMVPVEPTPEMIRAGRDEPLAGPDDDDAPEDYRAVYKAMLAAAPGKGGDSV